VAIALAGWSAQKKINAYVRNFVSRWQTLILKAIAIVCFTIKQKIERIYKMAELTITAKNFEETVLKNEKTVLLDFWATWCGPCQMIAPVVAQIAEENPDVVVGKVNVDEEMQLAQAFGITSIPTLIVFKNGVNVNTAVGLRSKAQIEEMIK
jgi:thioredoxin 1